MNKYYLITGLVGFLFLPFLKNGALARYITNPQRVVGTKPIHNMNTESPENQVHNIINSYLTQNLTLVNAPVQNETFGTQDVLKYVYEKYLSPHSEKYQSTHGSEIFVIEKQGRDNEPGQNVKIERYVAQNAVQSDLYDIIKSLTKHQKMDAQSDQSKDFGKLQIQNQILSQIESLLSRSGGQFEVSQDLNSLAQHNKLGIHPNKILSTLKSLPTPSGGDSKSQDLKSLSQNGKLDGQQIKNRIASDIGSLVSHGV